MSPAAPDRMNSATRDGVTQSRTTDRVCTRVRGREAEDSAKGNRSEVIDPSADYGIGRPLASPSGRGRRSAAGASRVRAGENHALTRSLSPWEREHSYFLLFQYPSHCWYC